ncbi:MAG: protein kinase [Candidatus Acidiferrales bacterium]
MPLTTGTKLGPYEITGAIGAGGMGEVYRARDTKLGREVALKVVPEAFARDADRMARFQREAQLLASLNHPHIASIYGIEDSSSGTGVTRALVMELVEGKTLADRIAEGPIPIEEALPIAREIAEALEYAHERGIIHRDLKPANIKVSADGNVKVLDFGLAKALETETAPTDFSHSPTLTMGATQGGMILGTAAYMSPEQARGKSADRRVDIWEFGCVLYEMLTGKKAFGGETVSDTLAAVIRAEPDWSALPSNTPARIRELLRRCLTKDPKQRLQSIGEARIAIETVSAGEVEASAISASTIAQISPAKRMLPWAVAGFFAIATGALLLLNMRPGTSAPARSVRFAVKPLGHEQFAFIDIPMLALSPDGQNLVFVAQKDGEPQLYLRSMSDIEDKPIAGTQEAHEPFFSPDGQWIAFFAADKLKKIPVGGGQPLLICDAVGKNQRGGSWGPDDTIVFSAEYGSPLIRVAAAGGKPVALTTLNTAKGERTHRWPQILPNGKGVIFTIGAADSPGNYDEALLAVYSFATRETRILLQGANMARYATSGDLLFTKGGVLYAAPFDEDRMEMRGSPVSVETGVGGDPSSGVGYWDISLNGTLAFVPGATISDGRSLAILNRKGEARVLPLPPRTYGVPRFSPDGKRLAFGIGKGFFSADDVWTYDLASGNLNRLTFGNNVNHPTWSPDGRQIVYAFETSGFFIAKRLADGSGQEEVITPKQAIPYMPESWSGDGKTLTLTDTSSTDELTILSLTGDHKMEPFQNQANAGVFSPDGKWIAYESIEEGQNNVYVRAFPASSGKWQVSTEGGGYPKWTKGGKELIYFDRGEKMMAVDVETQPSFHTGTPHLLFDVPQGKYEMRTDPLVNFDVTKDGEKFVLVQFTGDNVDTGYVSVTLNWFEELRKKAPGGKK